jgi:DNA-binding transcriptional regulator GbsR (MarR family)
MGEIIYLEDYLSKKEKPEEEQFSEDVTKVQEDLKKLIEDLNDPEFKKEYEDGYEEIMKAFKRVDSALDDYLDSFYIIMDMTGSVGKNYEDYYGATVLPEEEE